MICVGLDEKKTRKHILKVMNHMDTVAIPLSSRGGKCTSRIDFYVIDLISLPKKT